MNVRSKQNSTQVETSGSGATALRHRGGTGGAINCGKTSAWMRAFSVLIATFALTACTPALSRIGSDAEFAVIESGLVGQPDAKPYWVSDEEMLYAARTDETRLNVSSNERYPVYRATLWNARTNRIRRLHEMTGSLCYTDGYLLTYRVDFGKPPDAPVEHTYGRLGESLITTSGYPGTTPQFDPVTCRPRSESPKRELPEWTKGKTVRELEEIGGVLVLDGEQEKSLRNRPVSFHPNGAPDGIPMPFGSREHYIQGYHPFKGAYFILGTYFVKVPGHPDGGYGKSPWPEGTPRPYWWLYPGGKVEKGMFTPSHIPWDSSIKPFRNGVVWHVGFIRGEGVYVSGNSGEQRALGGFVQQVVTSPDGCRIAMNHRRSINDRWDTGTLKVIELCQGKRK